MLYSSSYKIVASEVLSHTFFREFIESIATDRALFSSEKMLISFLFLHENKCCGYSLEAPGTHNISFRGEIRKVLCGYPLLSVAMVNHLTNR